MLHLVCGRALLAVRTGVIDPMAFSAHHLAATRARCDPNGAKVELDFAPSETA